MWFDAAVVPVAVELGVLAAGVEVLHWPSVRGAVGVPCAGVVALLAVESAPEVLMALQVKSSRQQQTGAAGLECSMQHALAALRLTCQTQQETQQKEVQACQPSVCRSCDCCQTVCTVGRHLGTAERAQGSMAACRMCLAVCFGLEGSCLLTWQTCCSRGLARGCWAAQQLGSWCVCLGLQAV
jgi:hypothetical protein